MNLLLRFTGERRQIKLILPLESADYFIYFMTMPPKIFAFVMENPDNTYTIFLDPRRSFDQLLDDYIHELWHIIRGDFYSDLPVYIIESRAA